LTFRILVQIHDATNMQFHPAPLRSWLHFFFINTLSWVIF